MMNYWLLKTEPDEYSYDNLAAVGTDAWDGVANALALKHMRNMCKNDLCFIYHTGSEKAVVGVAHVMRTFYTDPNADNEKQIVVDIKATQKLPRPVTLAAIKTDAIFTGWELLRITRLSVMPVPEPMWAHVMKLSKHA
jgi:predicted RNA-binding protein with PUA-like domain